MTDTATSLTAWLAMILLVTSGCSGKFANIERPKGQIGMRRPEAPPKLLESFSIDPVTGSQSKAGLDITIRYASSEDLDLFFSKKEVFGKLAGKNPYPPQTLVFYMKIYNHSGRKIWVNPDNFVMIDNINIQYAELSPDNLSAIYNAKANVWSFAKSTGDLAPGPYGTPLKVAGALGGSGGRKLHYLMKQVRLAPGVIYDGIAYDGYVAFPRPHPDATSIRLILGNIKTDFDPADVPGTTIDFDFPLNLKNNAESAG